ncbi:MAG: hypothetical protein MUC95_07155, partial [Spirochaetes bacterium]|nr:hypothetical protein [Spirochaetota bacterium]
GYSPEIFSLPYRDGWEDALSRDIIKESAIQSGYMGLQVGGYYSEGAYELGGMVIHNTNTSNMEFRLALQIFKHESCIKDFFIWLTIAIERVFFKLIHLF